jgi:hypothetical protein
MHTSNVRYRIDQRNPLPDAERVRFGVSRQPEDRSQGWNGRLDHIPPVERPASATAEALDAVLELRGYVEELRAIELPKGFGRH